MKLESIALHHGYESKKTTRKLQQFQFTKLQDSLLMIRNMVQIYLTLRLREIFIQE
jgi:hypothetical protein